MVKNRYKYKKERTRQERYSILYCVECDFKFMLRITIGRKASTFHCPECGDFMGVQFERSLLMPLWDGKLKMWTPKEDEMLLFYKDKKKMKWVDIADAIGRSRDGCRNRYRILTDSQ